MLFRFTDESKIGQKNSPYDFDLILFWLVFGLIGLGVVMVYSSSIAIADLGGNPYQFLTRHLFALSIGLMLAFFATQLPVRFWEAVAPVLFLIGLFITINIIKSDYILYFSSLIMYLVFISATVPFNKNSKKLTV